MPREDAIHVEGAVVEVLGDGLVLVGLSNGHRVVGHVARRDRVRVPGFEPGGLVRLEMSPFDMSRGRVLVE